MQPRQKLLRRSLDATPICRPVVIACRRVGLRAEQQRQLAACPAAASASEQPEQQGPPPLRVAVIGGGFAGLAASYHLLAAAAGSGRAMQLTLYDAVGLGAGGSVGLGAEAPAAILQRVIPPNPLKALRNHHLGPFPSAGAAIALRSTNQPSAGLQRDLKRSRPLTNGWQMSDACLSSSPPGAVRWRRLPGRQ